MRKLLTLALAAAALAAGSAVAAGSADAAVARSATTHTVAAATARHTSIAVVRPVHANGRPVTGYRVTRERIAGFTCLEPSPVAVDRNIDFCGFSATYTMACWRSANHTALCLRDPLTKQLVRIRYSGTFARQAAVRHPVPQALRLMNGNECSIRDGGAWPMVIGHPSWFGDYSCDLGAVFGPGDGINRSVNPWRVHVVVNAGSPDQRITDHRVGKAWFVGTAA